MGIYSDRGVYSIASAAPATGSGAVIDCRATRGFYALGFATGGSAVLTVEASHLPASEGGAWLPVVTITAADGIAASLTNANYYPYLRGHYSGYAGATASLYIAPGVQ